jgi:hypothetical protein
MKRNVSMMKKKYWPYRLMNVFVIFISSLFVSCGSGPGDSETGRGKTSTILLEYQNQCNVWECEPYPIPADGHSSIHIRATLTDSSGTPVDQLTTVTFTTRLGHFKNGEKNYAVKTPDDKGIVEVSLMADTTPGWANMVCSSKGVEQSGNVYFTDHDAIDQTAGILLTADSLTLRANGVDSTIITATLTNNMGEPVPPGTYVSFHTNNGKFSSGRKTYSAQTPNETGIIRVSYIAGTEGGGADVCAYSNGVPQCIYITYTYPEDEDDDSDDADDADDGDG